MDYVLFGMGYGATLMLVGWALRTFGPERKYKNVDPEDIDRTVAQRRWVRFIQGLGGVLAIAGTAMVLFTFIVMLVNPDDETGSVIALAIWGFLAVAVLVWCWFYVSNYGVAGIWSREEGYGFRRTASSRRRVFTEGISTARVISTPDVDNVPNDVEVEPDIPESEETPSDIAANEPGDSGSPHEPGEDDAEQPEAEPESGSGENSEARYDFGDSADTTVPREIGGRSEAIRRLRERQARSGNSAT